MAWRADGGIARVRRGCLRSADVPHGCLSTGDCRLTDLGTQPEGMVRPLANGTAPPLQHQQNLEQREPCQWLDPHCAGRTPSRSSRTASSADTSRQPLAPGSQRRLCMWGGYHHPPFLAGRCGAAAAWVRSGPSRCQTPCAAHRTADRARRGAGGRQLSSVRHPGPFAHAV